MPSSPQSKRAERGFVAVRSRSSPSGSQRSPQRRVDERVVEPLDRHRDGLRGGDGEAVLVLADGAQAAGALVAAGDRLRVPGQRVDALLLGEPARDLAVRPLGGAPLVEQVEPLLPAAAGALADRLVGGRERAGAAGSARPAEQRARAAV